MRPEELIAFLERPGTPPPLLRNRGAAASAALILLWGLALNLTPCVLPLIPVNLAIIGAGVRAGSRLRGFALGALYGAGIAVAYGLLGLVAVRTGSAFGSLNASPWFNLAVAALFVVLALAAFNVVTIDFSRFQGRWGATVGGAWRWMLVPALGMVSALLAGACVAPAVIAVLALSADLYGRGLAAGQFLPFLLGIGMALPWPLAGAGWSLLPKPGKWMVYVERTFGVLILGLAFHYGRTACEGWIWNSAARRAAVARAHEASVREEGWKDSLAEGLAEAAEEGKPVFVDLWASWCKNCLAMEKTTFRAPAVRARLDSFVLVKVRAERPEEPPAREIMRYFGAKGLPTYAILIPRTRPGQPAEGPSAAP